MTPHAVAHSSLILLLLASGPLFAEQFGSFTYKVLYKVGHHEIEITDYPEDAVGVADIPSEIDGLPVTAIAPSAFYGCTGLTSVSIPEGVSQMGLYAFYGCSGLTEVTIPDAITWIPGFAFWGCTGLTSVSIPENVLAIDRFAFYGCTGLTDISNPADLNVIGERAFSGCASLTNFTIPDGTTWIRKEAFSDCKSLTSAIIPDSVIGIGEGAFAGCTSLTTLILPGGLAVEKRTFSGCTALATVAIQDGVVEVGPYAFENCASLTSIAFPSSVSVIGDHAFGGCTLLESALFLGNAPILELDLVQQEQLVFEDTAPGFTIYYLEGKSGFTSPSWQGHPSVGIDLRPEPFHGPATAGISFLAEALGIRFSAETSLDLVTWTNGGIALSEVDQDGRRTASVNRIDEQCYFRVVKE